MHRQIDPPRCQRFFNLQRKHAFGSKGMFTLEIEEALAAGRIDLAVHSLKDLPTELPGEFVLGATPKRVDPRDVLVSQDFASFEDLPKGARVGTSSLRRRAQLRF